MKLSNNIKLKRIEDNIFGFSYFVNFGGDLGKAIQKFALTIKRKEDYPTPAESDYPRACFTTPESYYGGLIWFSMKKPTTSIVSHEAFHATVHIANLLDIKLSNDSEEFFARYLDYLVEEIEKLKRKA